MNEQLIKQIILTEIGNEETLVALEKSIVPEEIKWLKGELVRDKEIVGKWVKNNGITQEEILAVRESVLNDAYSSLKKELEDTLNAILENVRNEVISDKQAKRQTEVSIEGNRDREEAIKRLLTKQYTWLQ